MYPAEFPRRVRPAHRLRRGDDWQAHTDAVFIRKQPLPWRAPGIIIEVGFVEMLREGEGWRKGETWSSRVNPVGQSTPKPSRSTGFGPPISRTLHGSRRSSRKVKDFVGKSPIVAHAYKNERDFLDYEFARAKVIKRGECAYAEERYICTQVLFAQLFPCASKSLTSMCDRLVLDSSERDDRHGALLDADMTADALILLERQLKHGGERCAEIMDLELTRMIAASISIIQPIRLRLSGRPLARHPQSGARRKEKAIAGALMKPAKRITDASAEQKVVREIMVFLHSHGVGTARAVRIFKTYGADAVQVHGREPLSAGQGHPGHWFQERRRDRAMRLGIEKTAMTVRLHAGISYALTEALDEGHCGLPTDQLIALAEELLEAPKESVLTALELERCDGAVIADKVGDTACTFLAGLYRAEQAIADRLIRIVNDRLP